MSLLSGLMSSCSSSLRQGLHFRNLSSFRKVEAKRFFPQYTVFKKKTCFILKFQSPIFKQMSGESTKNVSKKGKLRFEIIPRGGRAGGITNLLDWDNAVSMNLSAESVGQLMVDLSQRKPLKLSFDQTSFVTTPIDSSKNLGSYRFTVTHGQRVEEIVLSGGEVEVIKTLIRYSIPQLVAWDSLIHKSLNNLLNDADDDDGNFFYKK